ncbi:MAG TPA: high-potential iron-sulfur protein [Rhodanobacteraceae bacterium]
MADMAQSGRRRFLRLLGGAAAAVAVLGALPRRALAALPHLNPSTDATARALHYTDDARTDPSPHKPMQHCMMCQHYKGRMGEAWGPCVVFPGFDVNAMGWCEAYKPRMQMMRGMPR